MSTNLGARRLVQIMLRLGIGGGALVARTLARTGWKVSARSVFCLRRL